MSRIIVCFTLKRGWLGLCCSSFQQTEKNSPVWSFLLYKQKAMRSKGRKMENGSASAILWSCLAPVTNICRATYFFVSSSSFQSLSVRQTSCFPPNNSTGDVESGLRNCWFINYFRVHCCQFTDACQVILLVIFWCCLRRVNRRAEGLTSENCPFCSVWKPLQVHWKWSPFTVPAGVWDTSWAELSGPR